jgi:hypothetical protein
VYFVPFVVEALELKIGNHKGHEGPRMKANRLTLKGPDEELGYAFPLCTFVPFVVEALELKIGNHKGHEGPRRKANRLTLKGPDGRTRLRFSFVNLRALRG